MDEPIVDDDREAADVGERERRTARVVEVDGLLVADADTVVTDDDVLALIDELRSRRPG